MPILDVELIGPVPQRIRDGLASRIADAAGEVFESRPQGTWVKLRFVEASDYAENAGGPPDAAEPVIVSVLEAAPPTGNALAEHAGRLTRAIADACGRSAESVHLIFEPAATGRISFGGRLRH